MRPHPAPVFGRRSAPAAPRPAPPKADVLSPAAERLAAELVAAPGQTSDEFRAWRRKRSMGRAAAWAAAILLMTPGVISFVAHLPSQISAAIEAAGIGASWWLRRLRRNHLAAIRTWGPGQD